MSISLKVKVDKTLSVMKDIKSLTGMDVLVGIPEETTTRTGDKEEITNSQLVAYHTKGVRKEAMKNEMDSMQKSGMQYEAAQSMYISSHGSPLWKIPPRPIIEPAIVAPGNKERITEDLRIAGNLMLEGDKEAAIRALHVAGIDATNIVKAWFEDPRNNWSPLADSTVKAKSKKGKGKSNANQILVDTGQMRNAMTYVVDVKGE